MSRRPALRRGAPRPQGPARSRRSDARPTALGRPRLLVVGCGDLGLRLLALLRRRFRVFGVIASPARAAALRAAGAVPLVRDLDRDRIAPLAGLAPRVLHLAPPSPQGAIDRRTIGLQRALWRGARPAPGRFVYLSTTAVYGDRGGARIDETARPAPVSGRGRRRLDAERRLRAGPWRAAVLRVPGIYAADRLPLARLQRGTPALLAADDVYTNHIHAHDLARACLLALLRAAPARVYNVVDHTELLLGDYLDRVADRFGLSRPPRWPRAQLRAVLPPLPYSFLAESRRLANRRLTRELRLRLRYPDVDAGLAAAYASNSPSTDR